MRFANWVFLVAGAYGVLIVAPLYFLEQRFGEDYPPAITHPEFYYGFAGVTLACQVMFLIISVDPVRYRPMMIAAILEKVAYGTATTWLILEGRTPHALALTAAIDLTFGALFLAAFLRTPPLEARR